MPNADEIERFKKSLEADLALERTREQALNELVGDGMLFDSAADRVMDPAQGSFVRQLANLDLPPAEHERQIELYSSFLAEVGNSRRGSHKYRMLRARYRNEHGLKI